MTYRDKHLEDDLRKQFFDDAAYGRLLKAAKGVAEMASKDPRVKDLETYRYYSAKLQGIPTDGATCACCGFKNLVNIRRLAGQIVGPECGSAGHVFPCRRNLH